MVDHRLGAVDVLGLGVVQHAPAEGNDGPAHINDGHHDAVAEDVIEVALGAALDEAGGFQLLLTEAAALEVVQQAAEVLRRVAKTKPADGSVGQAALFLPVAAGHGGLRRFGVEVLVEVARGAAVDLQQALARTGLAVILLGQRHTGAARQLLDSLDIAEIVVLAHKVDDIARRTAAEAVKALGIRVNDEGRRFFIVERTQTRGRASAAAQLHILADNLFNVVAPHDFLYIFLGYHGIGCTSVSQNNK